MPALSGRQRTGLAKPLPRYESLAQKAQTAWGLFRGEIHVPSLTPERLAALVRKAQEAKAKAQMEALSDARRLADEAAYKALLDLYAVAVAVGRRNPEVTRTFEFLAEVFSQVRSKANGTREATQTAGSNGSTQS